MLLSSRFQEACGTNERQKEQPSRNDEVEAEGVSLPILRRSLLFSIVVVRSLCMDSLYYSQSLAQDVTLREFNDLHTRDE